MWGAKLLQINEASPGLSKGEVTCCLKFVQIFFRRSIFDYYPLKSESGSTESECEMLRCLSALTICTDSFSGVQFLKVAQFAIDNQSFCVQFWVSCGWKSGQKVYTFWTAAPLV